MPKLTRLRPTLRKTAKWGGLAASVLLCVIWVGSWCWTFCWASRLGTLLFLSQGSVLVGLTFEPVPREGFTPETWLAGPGLRGRPFTARVRLWEWYMSLGTNPSTCKLSVPLWFPPLLTAGITALAFRTDLLARRRALVGKCTACGYALDGLPPDAPCPECGKPAAAS